MSDRNIFDRHFGPPSVFLQGDSAEAAPSFEYTPVELDPAPALRMRCLELLLQNAEWSDIKDLLQDAQKLEEFVDRGRVPL